VLLRPPAHHRLAKRLAAYCRVKNERVHVAGSPTRAEDDVLEATAQRAADVTCTLIERLARTKSEVHVGIGAGQTSYLACVRLAQQLAASELLLCAQTKLVFHAISPGCDAERPLDDPSAKFALLDRIGLPTGFVGLFAEAVVPTERIAEVKRLPGTARAYERKGEIDIVLTSFASRDSARGLWNRYAACYPNALRQLDRLGWVGDLHFRPFAKDGPFRQDVGIEAVTLFTIDELRALAEDKDKHVVLISGPGKVKALIPVINCPELRCWDYLVTDVESATVIDGLREQAAESAAAESGPQAAEEPPPQEEPAAPKRSVTKRKASGKKKSKRRQR
jgi:DNA-binding transcriptional regulator LsrR (DeoR family)